MFNSFSDEAASDTSIKPMFSLEQQQRLTLLQLTSVLRQMVRGGKPHL
jgi:hypothetical protein